MNLTPEFLLERFPDAPLWRLSHPNGEPYLDRYCLWGPDCLENHSDAKSHCFLHRIYTADDDRHCHNHGWCWSTAIILSGGYTEKRMGIEQDSFLTYSPGDLNRLSAVDYHSIVQVESNTWTLFQGGKEIQDWGFWANGKHIPHKEYFQRNDAQHMVTTRLK